MQKQKIKYFLYARKSSESEDRQVQSIDDQINRLKALAGDLGIEIMEIITESHSAKMPGGRPLFNNMLERIESGKADGIICWQINRLSRNPVDSARVQWLLQEGVIKSIQTIDGERKPEDNVVLMSVEAGVSNQYIIDLRKNITRGLYSKLEKGWLPCLPPVGYKNDKENGIIVNDEELFSLVRKMWDLMLTGNYTPSGILEIANNEWGFTTPKRKRIGGNPLSLSGLYRMFNNQFYAGTIVYGNRTVKGKHNPIVTMDEYDQVQMLLGKYGKRRPKTKDFAFTGIIKCGACGCSITAEDHTKIIKSTGQLKTFTYYKCTRKKKYYKCTQKGLVNVNDLEEQISNEIKKHTIMPEFLDLALKIIKDSSELEFEKEIKIYQKRIKEISNLEGNLDNLVKMRYRGLIDDTIFRREKGELIEKIDSLKDRLGNINIASKNNLELTQKCFIFSTYAGIWFNNGTNQDKRTILNALGSNQTLENKKLLIKPDKWLIKVNENYSTLEDEYKRLELDKKPLNKGQKSQLDLIISQWWTPWE